MFRIFKFFMTGDWHLCKWEPYGKMIEVYDSPSDQLPWKRQFPCRCSVCGKIKKFEV